MKKRHDSRAERGPKRIVVSWRGGHQEKSVIISSVTLGFLTIILIPGCAESLMRQAFLAGLCFASWPFIGRFFRIPLPIADVWAGPMVMFVTTVYLVGKGRAELATTPPTFAAMFFLLLCGLVNAYGMSEYGVVLTGKVGRTEILLPATFLTMVAVSAVFGTAFAVWNGEIALTLGKVGNIFGGLVASAVAIYLFSR